MSGLRVGWLHYGMLAMIAASVVAMLSAVGIILAVGLLIAPGAIAFLLTRRLAVMMALATAIAVASALAGIWASFWLDSAPRPHDHRDPDRGLRSGLCLAADGAPRVNGGA